MKDISEVFMDEDDEEIEEDEEDDIEFQKDELEKVFYQFFLAIFYGQVLKNKSLYSPSLLERCLEGRITKIQENNNSESSIILDHIKKPSAYKKQISEMWRNYNQKKQEQA